MLDRLRQQLSSEEAAAAPPPAARRSARSVLGLTPSQLFILALMLFLNVSVLGCFALVAFEKIALPF